MIAEDIAVVSTSGGLDSTALLLHLLAAGYQVHAISFQYGQKHHHELNQLQKSISYLKRLEQKVSMESVDLRSAMQSFQSALTSTDVRVPDALYDRESMNLTVVPNRNAIFASIIYGYALSLAKRVNKKVSIALGVHSGDHEIYPDCRPEFYEQLAKAFTIGNWDSELVDYQLPYLHSSKEEVLKDFMNSAAKLKLDAHLLLQCTSSCYQPDASGNPCGTCGSCTERILAFYRNKMVDPLQYSSTWEALTARTLAAKQLLEQTNLE